LPILVQAVPRLKERDPSAMMDTMPGMAKIDVEQLRTAYQGAG